jgi:uncharacterized protein YqeY
MSTIREQIDAVFKQARRDRDEPTKNVIGMLKAKVLNELKSKKGGDETDELWLRTLGSYAKQLRKSIAQFEELGERGAEALSEAQFELDFCERFLPTKLDEAATEALVRRIAAEADITDKKMMGKLMGMVMKAHRDEVDPGVVKRVAAQVLS